MALIQQQNAAINTQLMELQDSVANDYIKLEEYNQLQERFTKSSNAYKELLEKHNGVIQTLKDNKLLDDKGNLITNGYVSYLRD